jgi:hypothetical protein
MPFCPNCRTEYRPGFVKCSDCGQPLTDKLPDNPADVTPEDYLVSAFDPPDPLIGHSLAALLEENGIRCILKSEQIPAYADVAMMLRPRWGRLMVMEGDLARAENLIKEYLSAPAQEGPEGEE